MNKHYTQIGEVHLPYHDNDEHATTLYIFDVDDEKQEELEEILGDCCMERPDKRTAPDWYSVNETIREDLNIQDEYNVLPGAPFHRYSVSWNRHDRLALIYETLAYNV